MQRAPKVPDSPASYANDVKSIAEVKAIDPLTVRFPSELPNPLFLQRTRPRSTSFAKGQRGSTTAGFQYRQGRRGNRRLPIRLVGPGGEGGGPRNENYWGEKPAFQRVTVKFISSDASRVAALLSGGVEGIDSVPAHGPGETERRREGQPVAGASTHACLYPYGFQSQPNPLCDRQVREAARPQPLQGSKGSGRPSRS